MKYQRGEQSPALLEVKRLLSGHSLTKNGDNSALVLLGRSWMRTPAAAFRRTLGRRDLGALHAKCRQVSNALAGTHSRTPVAVKRARFGTLIVRRLTRGFHRYRALPYQTKGTQAFVVLGVAPVPVA